MIFWLKRREHIFHYHYLVGFFLSPNLSITTEALDNKTEDNKKSVTRKI